MSRPERAPGVQVPTREDPEGDRRILGLVARGDGRALGDLYDRLGGLVFSLVLRIVDDWSEAEDLVQEVFAQVWRQASRYDSSRGTVAGWLVTIARSRAIDAVRARRARGGTPPGGGDRPAPESSSGPDVETAILELEQRNRLRGALASLPLLQRISIELAYFEGLTHAEIARRLDEPLGTVKTRIRLGLLKLRDALEAGS
jgi:RNA polymerase sigma-70 factor (ECF subfamily)